MNKYKMLKKLIKDIDEGKIIFSFKSVADEKFRVSTDPLTKFIVTKECVYANNKGIIV